LEADARGRGDSIGEKRAQLSALERSLASTTKVSPSCAWRERRSNSAITSVNWKTSS